MEYQQNKLHQSVYFTSQSNKQMYDQLIAFTNKKNLQDFELKPLHHAALFEEDKVILHTLPIYNDLQELSIDGMDALHIAAEAGNFKPLVILLLWQTNGDKQAAICKSMACSREYRSGTIASQAFERAEHEITRFPEHRLHALKNLIEQQKNRVIPAAQPIERTPSPECIVVEGIFSETVKIGFFSQSSSSSCSSKCSSDKKGKEELCDSGAFFSCSEDDELSVTVKGVMQTMS